MNLAELTLLIYVANTAGFTNHGPHKCSQGIQLNMPLKVSCFFHLNWMRNWSHHPHQHQPPSSTYQLSIYYCNPLLTLLGYPTSPFGKSPKNRKKTKILGDQETVLICSLGTPSSSCSAARHRPGSPVSAHWGPSAYLASRIRKTPDHPVQHLSPPKSYYNCNNKYNRYDITVLYRSIQIYTVLYLQDWRKIPIFQPSAGHSRVIADADQLPSATRASIRDPICASPAWGKNCHCLVLKMMMQYSFQGMPLGVPQFWTWHQMTSKSFSEIDPTWWLPTSLSSSMAAASSSGSTSPSSSSSKWSWEIGTNKANESLNHVEPHWTIHFFGFAATQTRSLMILAWVAQVDPQNEPMGIAA